MRFFGIFILLSVWAEASPWVGTWDTVWRSGRTQVILREEGDKIVGEYPAYNGIITAEADSEGNLFGIWKEPKLEGTFFFTLSPDQQTFAGRFHSGEWWNGRRVDPTEQERTHNIFLEPDLSSPRATMKSFVAGFGYLETGDSRFLKTVSDCLDFPDEIATGMTARRITLLKELFRSIDATTFRIWSLPGPGSEEFDDEKESEVTITLRQAGTGQETTVTFTKITRDDEKIWLISPPPLDTLLEQNTAFLKARGRKDFDPAHYLTLDAPRHTLLAFLIASKATTAEERSRLRETMDVSWLSIGTVDNEVRLFTEYLKNIIDRAGFIIWQEIPDDPDSTLPYLHYGHPKGDIVIAPFPQEDGTTKWKFTRETLENLPYLYEAVEQLPIVEGVPPAALKPLYFRVREAMLDVSPFLLKRSLVLENWQWLAFLLVLVIGWFLARFLTHLVRRILHWRMDEKQVHVRSEVEARFLRPVYLAFLAFLWMRGFDILGLPEHFHRPIQLITQLLLVIGVGWATYNFIDILGAFFQKRANKTSTTVDDIVISFVASIGKIVVIVASFVIFADALSIPYRTVIASLGIGGLAIAIAAKDTLANFFGSAVLLADRPFRRGDLVEIGDVTGNIVKVGLRSTHIRTLHDSLVIIPNSVLANEQINNLKRRRRRHIRSLVSVTYSTPPDLLDSFRARLLKIIETQPGGENLEKHAGVWEFAASSIDLEIFCYVDAQNRAQEYELRHGLFVDIVRAAEEMGVEFAFPTRTLYMESNGGSD